MNPFVTAYIPSHVYHEQQLRQLHKNSSSTSSSSSSSSNFSIPLSSSSALSKDESSSSFSPSSRPGYFKPPQVIKSLDGHEFVATVSINTGGKNEEQNDKQIEELPKPLAFTAEERKAFGLPAYNGPEGFQPRRGSGAADYTTNGVGYVVYTPVNDNNNQQIQKSGRRESMFEMPSSSSRVNQYRKASSPSYSSSPNERRVRSGGDYSPMESASEDLNTYMKEAASENSHHTSDSGSSSGSSQGNAGQSVSYNSYGDRSSVSSQSVRRKPTYGDDSQSYEPSSAKHYMKTQVIREHDMGSGGGLHTDALSSGHEGSVLGSSNDNELAQLAATMSEYQSSVPGSGGDFLPSSFSSGNPNDLTSLMTEAHGFGGLGSSSLLGGHSFASPIPAASSVPGTHCITLHPLILSLTTFPSLKFSFGCAKLPS